MPSPICAPVPKRHGGHPRPPPEPPPEPPPGPSPGSAAWTHRVRPVSHPVRTIDIVSLTTSAVRPAEALDELARSIESAKAGDRLAPVTVVVPTNTCGVMSRRALGRRVGIVGVDMVTLNRLAELIAGPTLAAAGRSPMSSSLVDLAIAQVLEAQPGVF